MYRKSVTTSRGVGKKAQDDIVDGVPARTPCHRLSAEKAHRIGVGGRLRGTVGLPMSRQPVGEEFTIYPEAVSVDSTLVVKVSTQLRGDAAIKERRKYVGGQHGDPSGKSRQPEQPSRYLDYPGSDIVRRSGTVPTTLSC